MVFQLFRSFETPLVQVAAETKNAYRVLVSMVSVDSEWDELNECLVTQERDEYFSFANDARPIRERVNAWVTANFQGWEFSSWTWAGNDEI